MASYTGSRSDTVADSMITHRLTVTESRPPFQPLEIITSEAPIAVSSSASGLRGPKCSLTYVEFSRSKLYGTTATTWYRGHSRRPTAAEKE